MYLHQTGYFLFLKPVNTKNPMAKYVKNIDELSLEEFEDILIYFTTNIPSLMDEESVYWSLAKDCIAKLGLEDCVVYQVDLPNEQLIQKAAYGPKNPKEFDIYNPVSIKLGQGISGTVASTGIAEIVSDTSLDDRYIMDDAYRFSEITVPIMHDGEIFGVLDCEHPDRNHFSDRHLKILNAITTIAAIKIKQLRTSKKIEEEQEKLLKIKSDFVDLKLKAFQAHMNPHFVFNTMNAIQYFITSDDKVSALNYISLFSKLIRYYLKNFHQENLSLKEELNMLDTYLRLQKLRYDKQLEYNLEIEPAYTIEDVQIPSFILQTLFENIIEHAIFNKYRNFRVNAKFKPSKHNLLLEIVFQYERPKNVPQRNLPEYREEIIKWQDQIRSLNKFKGYKIKKHVSFNREPEINGGNIILKLPNLS